MTRLKRTLLHPTIGGSAPNASPFMPWMSSVFFLPIIGTRVSFFVRVGLGRRLPAPDRFEEVYHESGGDDGRDQVEDGHGQHQRDDHPTQENAPTIASPHLPRQPWVEAPERHGFMVFAAEKIAVQPVKYKEIQGR